jgi:hypothetical protein
MLVPSLDLELVLVHRVNQELGLLENPLIVFPALQVLPQTFLLAKVSARYAHVACIKQTLASNTASSAGLELTRIKKVLQIAPCVLQDIIPTTLLAALHVTLALLANSPLRISRLLAKSARVVLTRLADPTSVRSALQVLPRTSLVVVLAAMSASQALSQTTGLC